MEIVTRDFTLTDALRNHIQTHAQPLKKRFEPSELKVSLSSEGKKFKASVHVVHPQLGNKFITTNGEDAYAAVKSSFARMKKTLGQTAKKVHYTSK